MRGNFSIVAVLAVAMTGWGQGSAQTRIGTFDSRCVAVAYYNSPDFQKEKPEYQGPAVQSLMHYQVFSNASIPNIVDKLGSVLPTVAADARVSMIVSKWDVAFKDASVEYVDVTDALVQALKPDAKVVQWAASLKPQPPMPLLHAVKTLRPDR